LGRPRAGRRSGTLGQGSGIAQGGGGRDLPQARPGRPRRPV